MITNLTIAVCTKDRFQSLENCLDHAARSIKSAGLETQCAMLVIDDGALSEVEKNLLHDVSAGIPLHYYRKSGGQQRGLYGSRRLAVELVETSHIMFIDDDCMIGSGYVKAVFEAFRSDAVVAVSGVDRRNLVSPGQIRKRLWETFLLCNANDYKLSPTGFNFGHALWLNAPVRFFSDFVHGCNMTFCVDAIRRLPECPWLSGHSIAEDLVISHTALGNGKILILPELDFIHWEIQGGRDYGVKKIKKKLASHWNFGKLHNPSPIFPLLFCWSTIGLCINALSNVLLTKIGKRKAQKA